MSAGGVTLIPNSQLMFAGGKEGVIFLLNRDDMGKLEGENGGPLQRFQGHERLRPKGLRADSRNGVLGRKNDGVLYVWDRRDVLRAYNFVNNRFVTTPAAVSAVQTGDERWPQRVGEWLRRGERHRVGRHDAIDEERRACSRDTARLPRLRRRPGNLQQRYEQRARRARRFHKVCATGGREWKSLRADAVRRP